MEDVSVNDVESTTSLSVSLRLQNCSLICFSKEMLVISDD